MTEDLPPVFLQQVTDLVRRVVLESTGRSLTPKPDDRLIEAGHLDSMSIVNLVLALQQEFQVTLELGDLSEANFGSVRAIAHMVRERQG